MKKRLIIIGSGMAGGRLIEELLDFNKDMYEIDLFGEEKQSSYNRVLISTILAGHKKPNEILLSDPSELAEKGIKLHLGKKVVEINRAKQYIKTADGEEAKYDKLVFATGAKPTRLNIAGANLPSVFTFRKLKDVEGINQQLPNCKSGLVIGGGLLGLEVAHAFAARGLQATVLHRSSRLMGKQLDSIAGSLLRADLEKMGVKVITEKNVKEITEDNGLQVLLDDGTTLKADIAVMAAGTSPNITLAKSAGLQCNRGILVSDTMQSFDPNIYAIGECAEHRGEVYGFVAPSFEMAKVCANQLSQRGHWTYSGSKTSTRLKVEGVELFSAGEVCSSDEHEEITLTDKAAGVHRQVLVKENKIAGVVLYGDVADGPWIYKLMRDEADITDLRKRLLYGSQVAGEPGREGRTSIAEMSDDTEVCGCNGITKGHIVKAITEKGLFTLDDVKKHTKAAGSCGSCSNLVEQILAATLGEDYSSSGKKSLCNCTDLSHEEVKLAISDSKYLNIPAAMTGMGWKTVDGCATCRPAINYYLLVAWPAEAEDDSLSRVVNERMHANLQKDGTFSLIPRMLGGVTSPAELHSIANIAEKYDAKLVKMTGGQRIALFGLKRQQLPDIWKDATDAGLVSGYAYSKGLRTVKTCVGNSWCRFGTQDSMALGMKIEGIVSRSWTPAKLKFAVSGCPRNCAEATIKDIGIIGVDSGWELYVGGNGGIKVRVTDLLCKLKTEEQVMEYALALMQLYREEARYAERMAPWVERFGLSKIKKRIVEDDSSRQSLYARFIKSQKNATDPWTERAGEKSPKDLFSSLEVLPAGGN